MNSSCYHLICQIRENLTNSNSNWLYYADKLYEISEYIESRVAPGGEPSFNEILSWSSKPIQRGQEICSNLPRNTLQGCVKKMASFSKIPNLNKS